MANDHDHPESDRPDEPLAEDGATTDAEELIEAEGPDVEISDEDRAILDEAERDLVAEYRDRAARAEAELANFRMRVERDRVANREAVVADVIRSLLPVIDDLDLAEQHGDLGEGSPLALIAQKLRGGFEKQGLRRVGEKGEVFDPNFHEAIAQLPQPGATEQTVADVVQIGYALGDRLLRAAKVAVAVPAD
jgi:molecular chaperone GrpE